MNYKKKIEWLFEQFPTYQKVGKLAYKPGLESMQAFDDALGNPHRRFRTIHVAGTNGKGSTSHMLAAGLSSCGLKVGLYTSPHLQDFRERMKIVRNGKFRMISKKRVFDFLCRWDQFFTENKPSFFEITTAMAFDWFASQNVDIAVIETGLGGRLDSTNVITPILSVITNIGLEHCEHLGYTLEAIAGEKAGIIKPGVPAVVGEFLPETRPVFEAKAEECGSSLLFAAEAEEFLSLTTDDLDLKGDYQQRNLRTLSAAASLLAPMIEQFDRELFEQGVRKAAQMTGLHGRWETIREADPATGKARVICDTGHNAHGIRWVAEQVDRVSCDYRKVYFILGVVKEKDIDAIAPLLPRNVRYIFTQPSSQRALNAVDLANEMSDHGIFGIMKAPVAAAFEYADSHSGADDLIFVGGSNFTVADVLDIF